MKINFRHCIEWFPNVRIQIGSISMKGEYVEITGDPPKFPSMENRREMATF